jgi:photosystem II stability/assembly factor-like uncharacterized protein
MYKIGKKFRWLIFSPFCLLLSFTFSQHLVEQNYVWHQIPLPDSIYARFYDLHFFNDSTGWICSMTRIGNGNRNVIAYTKNGFLNWDTTIIQMGRGLFITFSNDGQVGLTGEGAVIRTINGGQTWEKAVSVGSIGGGSIVRMEFASDSIVWGSGTQGTILKSTDAGLTWELKQPEFVRSDLSYKGLSIVNNQIVFALCGFQLIYTSDGGDNWSEIPFPIEFSRMIDVKFIDKDYGWITGEYRTILRTTDGGNTWEDQSPKPIMSDAFKSIDALDYSTAIVSSTQGAIFRTDDGGKTWIEQIPRNVFPGIERVQIINKDVAYAVGASGLILKTTNGSTTSINEGTQSPKEYILYQNYPNPFNSITTIRYSLPEDGKVTIKVYDILGREIATLVNEEKPAGTHSVNFSVGSFGAASNLTSGVYFYQLIAMPIGRQASRFVETKKMILLR